MFRFIKNQKQKLIIMIIAITMIITAMPIFTIAATDTKVPEIVVNVRAGRVKAGTQLSFTITDESGLGYIFHQWDRHLDSNSKSQQFSENSTKYVLKTTAPKTLGLHEFSVAAQDSKGNITAWLDVPYYVVAEDVPANYVDNTLPKFIVNTPDDYPYNGSTIPQGRKIKIGLEDENDIYWMRYKWVRELDEVDYATGSTVIYKPGKEVVVTAPLETGEWWLQFYSKDGSNNTSKGAYSVYTVADLEKPVVTLNGQAEVDVPLNGTYNDPGATWTDTLGTETGTIAKPIETLDTSKVGSQTLTYSYTDAAGNTGTAIRIVTVVGNETTYELTPPTKTEYKVGEEINLEGAQIKVTDPRGNVSYVEPTASMFKYFSTEEPSNDGQATFTYGGKTVFYNYIVKDSIKSVDFIEPTQKNYQYGDTLNLTDAKIKVTMASEKVIYKDVTETMLTYDKYKVGKKQIVLGHFDGKDLDPDYTGTNFDFQILISKKPITIEINNVTSVYGEKLKTLTYNIPNGALVYEDTEDILNIQLTKEEGTDEGTYNINGTVNIDTNYEVTFTPGKYTITKANITDNNVTVNVPDTFTYDGTKTGTATVTVAGVNGNLVKDTDYTEIIKYVKADEQGNYDNTTATTTAPTDAGTYKVITEITITNKNYATEVTPLVVDKNSIFTINKANAPQLETTTLNATYGQTLDDIKDQLTSGWSFVDELTTSVGNATQTGNTFKVKYDGDANHEASTSNIDVTVIVEKADAPELTTTTLNATYGQTLNDIKDQLTPGWTFVDELTTSVGNATQTGNTFAVKYDGDDNHNPATENAEVKVIVEKADAPELTTTTLNATYGQTLNDIKDQLTSGWTFVDELTTLVGNATETGNTFKVKYGGDDNHKPSTENVDVTVIVAKKALTNSNVTAVAPTNTIFTGDPIEATYTLNGITADDVDVEITYGTELGSTAPTNAGSYTATVTITAKANGNYSGTATSTVDFIIRGKTLSDSDVTAIAPTNTTFTGNAIEATYTLLNGLTANDVDVEITYTGENVTSEGKAVNVGNYTATVTITAKADGSYTGSGKSTVNFTIEPKEITATEVTVNVPNGFTYDGTTTAGKATVTVPIVNGTLTENTDYTVVTKYVKEKADGTYDNADATEEQPKNAGTYKVITEITITNKNYTVESTPLVIDSEENVFTINKAKAPELTTTTLNATY